MANLPENGRIGNAAALASIDAKPGTSVWVDAENCEYVAVPTYLAASNAVAGPTDPEPISWQPKGVVVLTPSGITADGCIRSIARKTQLDKWIAGEPGVTPAVRSLLAEATIICPLRDIDRYWDATATRWKSRNYGSLGDGIDLGSATEYLVQCSYTDGKKGVRTLASAGLTCPTLRIPAASMAIDSTWTLIIRYQCPPQAAGSGPNYQHLMFLGDCGAGGVSRYYAKRHTTTLDTMRIADANITTPFDQLSPRVFAVTAETGAAGAVKTYINGGIVQTTAKISGTPSGNDHIIGGGYFGGGYYGYPNLVTLDVIAFSRTLTDAEVTTITSALQHSDAPTIQLLSGQSNIVGMGTKTEATSQGVSLPASSPRVGFIDESVGSAWDKGWAECAPIAGESFGPELSICEGKSGLFLKYGRGASLIGTWTSYALANPATVALTDGLMRALWLLSCNPTVGNFVFLQGENDAADAGTTAVNYAAALTALAANYRAALNSPSMRMVIGRLSDDNALGTNTADVRAGQAAFAGVAGSPGVGGGTDSHAVLIDLDSVPRTNGWHWRSSQILQVGRLLKVGMQ